MDITQLNGKTIGFNFWNRILPTLDDSAYTSSCLSLRPARLSIVIHYAKTEDNIIKEGFPVFFTVKESLSEKFINWIKENF